MTCEARATNNRPRWRVSCHLALGGRRQGTLPGGRNDQRQDHPDRAPRLSDRGVQGADDLQPLVREAGHRRRRRADGRARRRTIPTFLRSLVRLTQHPRRARDDAAQGHDRRRLLDECVDRRCRSPARATRCCCAPTARCSATCSTARASSRGVKRKGFEFAGASCLIVGPGGVGSAIAASIAAERRRGDDAVRQQRGVGRRPRGAAAAALSEDGGPAPARTIPAGYDLVVNATPLGMKDGDPLPFDVARIDADDLRRRGRDEAGDHAVPARRAGEAAAGSRSAPTCCSSRFPPTSNSSASGRRRPTSCARWRRSRY